MVSFSQATGQLKCRLRSLTMRARSGASPGRNTRRVPTTRRGKLAADLLQVQRRVTIYSRLGSKSPKGMAVGKRSPGHHIEAPEQRDRLQQPKQIDEHPDAEVPGSKSCCHCDERSEEVISIGRARAERNCFASLAMTVVL